MVHFGHSILILRTDTEKQKMNGYSIYILFSKTVCRPVVVNRAAQYSIMKTCNSMCNNSV